MDCPRLFDPGDVPPAVQHPSPRQVRSRHKRMRNRVTCGEVVDQYLRHKKAIHAFEPRTLDQVQSLLAKFVKHCGPRPVSELLLHHVTDFIEGNDDWKANGTRARVADGINAVLNWAVEQNRIGRNPVKALSRTYPASDPREPVDDVTFERLCEAAPKELERVMRFLRAVGCRPGETLRCLWEDIDLEKCLWVLKKHKTWKRTRKPKTKVLPPSAIKLLLAIGPKPFGPVFCSRLGRPWCDTGSLDRAFANVKRRLKVPAWVKLHCIRHRFITAAAAKGAPVPAIAEQVGHSDLASTWRYIHMPTEIESVRTATLLAQPKD